MRLVLHHRIERIIGQGAMGVRSAILHCRHDPNPSPQNIAPSIIPYVFDDIGVRLSRTLPNGRSCQSQAKSATNGTNGHREERSEEHTSELQSLMRIS